MNTPRKNSGDFAQQGNRQMPRTPRQDADQGKFRHGGTRGHHPSNNQQMWGRSPNSRRFNQASHMENFSKHGRHVENDERELEENRIVQLEKPSPMFPNAKWFCKLCHQHFNQISTGLNHCDSAVHTKKKVALDLRKVVLAMPRVPHKNHEAAVEAELLRIYKKYRMTEESIAMRQQIVTTVESYIRNGLKDIGGFDDVDFVLNLQGSSLSEMGLLSSNINLDFHPTSSLTLEVQAKMFCAVLKLLETWKVLSEVEPLFNLTVPKIKAFHRQSKLQVDISLGGAAAMKTNRLLKDYSSLDSRVAPLVVAFRYWANKCRLDDPQQGTLPPHAFSIMTVFYLQQVSPPVLPCIHDTITNSTDEEKEETLSPDKFKGWKSENSQSIGQLWLGMLRFFAAEFRMRKLCVTIRTRKRTLLANRKWPSRYIGIEDPYCRKKSLSKSIVSDPMMTYVLMCLRASYIYFATPRTNNSIGLIEPKSVLDILSVEDPEGDDIEDGLAADEDADDEENEQEIESETGPSAMDYEEITDLRGWNQNWPSDVWKRIAHTENFNYSLEVHSCLTNNYGLPKVCVQCRQPGHSAISCVESQLPRALPAAPEAFKDAQGIHSALCRYIFENFRPTLTEQELNSRIVTVQQIEEFIQTSIPEAYLTLFGSSTNGFSLHKADLDICLKYKGKDTVDESMDVRDIIFRMATILETHPHISDVQPIVAAKVPIVKFCHDAFGVDGDISLYNVLAEHNTAMLKAYSLIDSRVVELGAAFKQYVKLCDMGDASRGSLSSYAYVIMLIHYLQYEGVVPVLQKLPPVDHPENEELPKIMVDGWNAYYFDDIDNIDKVWPGRGKNEKTVGELWLGLIDYYATKYRFDLNVVCIRQLEPLSRLEKMWTNKNICIEDPFELDHNLGSGVSPKMAKYIISALLTSRNWFLIPVADMPQLRLDKPSDIYKHYMDAKELAVGKPPNDRGCKLCGKIGHWIKACPNKAKAVSEEKTRVDRRVCHHCQKPGHIIRECPERLQKVRASNSQEKTVPPRERQPANAQNLNATSTKDPSLSPNALPQIPLARESQLVRVPPLQRDAHLVSNAQDIQITDAKTDVPYDIEMQRVLDGLTMSFRTNTNSDWSNQYMGGQPVWTNAFRPGYSMRLPNPRYRNPVHEPSLDFQGQQGQIAMHPIFPQMHTPQHPTPYQAGIDQRWAPLQIPPTSPPRPEAWAQPQLMPPAMPTAPGYPPGYGVNAGYGGNQVLHQAPPIAQLPQQFRQQNSWGTPDAYFSNR